MKTLLGCEACIHSYLAIDGTGYYCKQPDYKKIECVKAKLAHHITHLEINKSSDVADNMFDNLLKGEEAIKTSDPNMDNPEIIQRCIPIEGTVEELERCNDRAEQYYMSGKLSDKKYGELCRRYYMDI